MNIFNSLPIYNLGWTVTNRRHFSEEEIAEVEKAEVIKSDYGLSVCFYLKQGGNSRIPLSNQSSLGVGDLVNMENAEVLTLSKRGEEDIMRIEA